MDDSAVHSEAERQRFLLQRLPGFVAVLRGPRHLHEYGNDAWHRLVGPRDALGRPLSEAVPELAGDVPFVERLDRVYAGGESFASQAMPLRLDRIDGERVVELLLQPIRDAGGAVTGVLVGGHDVTDRVRAEKRREALLRLDARLADVVDTADLSFAASELLAAALGAVRVGYGTVDVDAGTIVVERDWSGPGFVDVAGMHRFEDFGDYFDALCRGEPVAVSDVAADPRTADKSAAFRALGIGAFLDIPVVERGRTVAQMFVHASSPRAWTQDELLFVRDFAERTRAAIARRRAENALKASEEFNRRMLESSADCIKVLDLDGRLEFMSEGGMCIMEVDDFAAIRQACWPDFWGGEEHAKALEAVATARRGGTGRFEGFATTMKGSPRWWDVAVTPILGADGRPEKLLSVSRDVTAARASEARLRELAADLERQVIERTQARGRSWALSPDLMGALGPDAVFETANPAWQATLGWSEDELRRTPIWSLLHPDDLERSRAAFAESQLGRPVFRFPNRYRQKTGGYRWISWIGVPEDGLIYCTGRDITDEKEREAELALRTEQLRQAQKMEAVGQLTGGIAHDFNNLLTGVLGSLDLVQRRIAQGRHDEIQRHLGTAAASAQRAAALVHRLLAFSRRQPLDPKPVDANRRVVGMEELLRRTIGAAVRLEIATAPDLGATRCDPHQLDSAILNLAINARDAMPGGGLLTIETANVVLDADSPERPADLAAGRYVRIRVTDTGTGMDEATIARAFDPFFTTKPVGQGTGLGLSMIWGFARQSDGQVRIASVPGSGTTVALDLPRLDGDAAATATGDDDPAPAAAGAAVRLPAGDPVLVVEDEAAVRGLVVDVLRELGLDAVEAADGPAGIEALRSPARFSLLVTDIGLPGLDGRRVAEAARALRPGLKVLFMTAYAGNATGADGFLEPGSHWIAKPFALDALAARLREIVLNG